MTAPQPAPKEYDVYCSYAPPDAEKARAVSQTLINKGLRVWRRESPPDDLGAGFEAATDTLARSRLMLVLYTPAYARHPLCQMELTTAVLSGRRENEAHDRIIVLAAEEHFDDIEPVELRGVTAGRIPKPKNTKGLGAVSRAVRDRLEAISGTMGRIQNLARPPWHGSIGQPFPEFVGRLPLMWEIHGALRQPPVAGEDFPPAVNLSGLAGSGKTALTREYALRFGSEYPGGVFWLRAYGAGDHAAGMGMEERLAERDRQIREFAAALGVIIANRGPVEIRIALGDALGRRQRACLWIVDDLPPDLGEDGVKDWIGPHPLAHTIITSRERQSRSLARQLELSPLAEEESVDLLTAGQERVGSAERDVAAQLANELGGHALGVKVLGSVYRQTGQRLNAAALRHLLDAAQVLDAKLVESLEDILPEGNEAVIAATIALAIEALDDEGKDFLRVASVLAAAPIQPTLLSAVWKIVLGIDGEDARDVITRSWTSADALALTEMWGATVRERSVHPVVTQVARAVDANPARMETVRAAAVAALRDQLPARYDPSAYAAVEHEISHARELVRRPSTISEAELLGRVARYDLVRAAYESAAGLFRRQVDAYHDIHGREHPETARALGSLAGVMFLLGDVAQARSLHEQAFTIRRETLGDDHVGTLVSMNNLATLLGVEGQLVKARQLQEEILEIRKRTVGPDHADTLTAMNNLAATLDAQGELERVRELQQTVLDTRVRRLGPEHPQTTSSAWALYATLSRLRDDRAANEVLNQHLTWLLEREPAALGADQQNIRNLLAEHRQL